MTAARATYLPAASHDWALPLYDPFVKLLGGDAIRAVLLDQAAVQSHHRILDVGCGTGTFALMIKRRHRDADVVGLDPDPKALARAARKAQHAAVSVRFDQGFADRLPYPDGLFDRVFSSFMFHHLAADDRAPMLREVRRVLTRGGSLHLVDFVQPEASAGGRIARMLHSSSHLRDNAEGRVLALMNQAGLADAKKVGNGAMLFGAVRLAYYQARTPTSSAAAPDREQP